MLNDPYNPKSSFALTIMNAKYAQNKKGETESWSDIARRVTKAVMGATDAPKALAEKVEKYIRERKFVPGGRYLYASGRPLHQVNNCTLYRAEDSREGWAALLRKTSMALMTGAGIGVDYSRVRAEGALIRRTGGHATGPIALMKMMNEVGRGIMQGGARRSAIYASLSWKHPDALKFIHAKDWSPEVRALKNKDFNFPADLDMTNISIQLDDEFFHAYHNPRHKLHSHASSVYWDVIQQMLTTAEPGFQIDCGVNAGETLRNACVVGETEVFTRNGPRRIDTLIDGPVEIFNGEEWSEVRPCITGYNEQVMTVTLEDGRSLTCTLDHRLVVLADNGEEEARAETLLGIDFSKVSVKLPVLTASVHPRKVVSAELAGYADVVYCFNEPIAHRGVFNQIVTFQCTEITSSDDSDVCNIGSINMSRITSLEEMEDVVEAATAFLLCGTIYSDVPHEEVRYTREKNRRLGLGLMGLHEWLLVHGYKYGPNDELAKYLEVYATSTEKAARIADKLEISHPVKTRAIAPTGTIGILSETTTGCEPIFCVAYKRRYLKHKTWCYQYVIDPTAQRLIDSGVNPEIIEDAYILAEDVERRVAFQAWLSQYVDHAISSTINLPAWGSELNNSSRVREFGDMLIKYLPSLRGITCYPDGARGGQPLTPVSYHTAKKHLGTVFEEGGSVEEPTYVEAASPKTVIMTDDEAARPVDVCDISKSGSCGS